MAKRITLTAREIDALLTASGDVDVSATFEDAGAEAQQQRMYDAWETGRQKLAAMLAKRQSRRMAAESVASVGRKTHRRMPPGLCPSCGKKGLSQWRTVGRSPDSSRVRECRYCCHAVIMGQRHAQ